MIKQSLTPPEHVQASAGNAPAGNTLPWKAYVPIALVALIGVLVTWYAFNVVTDWERQRVQQAFSAAATDRILMVEREIEQNLGVVQDIGSFFDASQRVDRREFRKFVGPALKRYASIVALQWIPRITETERASFEEEARRSFAKFRITESNQAGELVKAAQRPVHFPILYVQPYQLNKEALGLDLASDPAILEALQQTRDAGQMWVSPRIPLEREGRVEYDFVARLPVYNKIDADEDEGEAEDEEKDAVPDTLEQRQLQLRGFAAGIFRIGEIVESALQNLSPSGIDMVIHDVTGENERHYLYRHSSRKTLRQTPAGAIPGTGSHGNTWSSSRLSISRIVNGKCCAPRSPGISSQTPGVAGLLWRVDCHLRPC